MVKTATKTAATPEPASSPDPTSCPVSAACSGCSAAHAAFSSPPATMVTLACEGGRGAEPTQCIKSGRASEESVTSRT
eukprot:9037864-Pyramimonas_sp.AAC.1